MKKRGRRTKIICTIGPASRSEDILAEMMRRGMGMARLNFAHGTQSQHAEDIKFIRSASARVGKPCAILIDLPGPKIRVGKLRHEPIQLRKDHSVWLTPRKILGLFADRIPVDYPRLTESVKPGAMVFLNDGFIQLRVEEVKGSGVKCRVLMGGDLFSRKGLNLPGSPMFVEPVTDLDLRYIEFGLSQGVDLFGISFLEKASDIRKAKAFAAKKGRRIRTVAKIERAEALENIDPILSVADMVMVARGDLGVQIPLEDVPFAQKEIIRKARARKVPVITATQMLESMVQNVRPTRAEASDVANAILDGTDFVMLSAETAIGAYPLEAVEMMARIALRAEGSSRVGRRK